MRVGRARQLAPELLRKRFDPVEHPTGDQRQAGVHDVLRRCAPVEVACRLGRRAADLLEQRQDRIADDERPFAEARELDSLRCGSEGDLGRSLRRDDPELGLCCRQCPLHLEPGAHERFLREEPCDVVVAEHVDERKKHHHAATRCASM